MPVTASAIALGSNIGDSFHILENALTILAQTPKIQVTTHSSWYRTNPIGPAQPDYLNGCAILEVDLNPEELLALLLDIELQFGRMRGEKWGPRTLDLDILLFGNLIVYQSNLQIPHPRMGERAFVLVPLAEIAPHWLDPLTGLTIAQLLEKIGSSGIIAKYERTVNNS